MPRRNLILTLSDDKEYTFTTLTRKQISAYMKSGMTSEAKAMSRLEEKMADEGLSESEIEQYEAMQQTTLDMTDSIVRQSISKHHPEFAIVEDEEENKKRTEYLQEIMDMRDTALVFQFAMKGTVQKMQDEILEPEKDIRL